jgi:hypothetical protein
MNYTIINEALNRLLYNIVNEVKNIYVTVKSILKVGICLQMFGHGQFVLGLALSARKITQFSRC